MKIAVVGAGMAGLTAAFRLAGAHDVEVFESAANAGGNVRTQRLDGYVFEWGPNGFLSNAAELARLVAAAGLQGDVVPASAAASKRYVYSGGRLHALPSKPQQALTTTLIPPAAKLRALSEVLQRPPASQRDGESVHAFFARHFGELVADRVVAPALLGITGGDARSTSARALFPRLYAMEAAKGSLIRAFAGAGRTPARLQSFGPDGMQRLPDAIAQRLGERVHLASPVERVERSAAGWTVVTGSVPVRADAVVLATPAYAAATLCEPLDATLAAALRRIAYAPMRVCGIAYRAADVPAPLDGFGFLAARGQGVRLLGALYTSTIFPAHAPPGVAYLRVFLGGSADAEAVRLDAAAARAIVERDLATTLGIAAAPLVYHERVWPQAIPQYALDHLATLAEIDRRVAAFPGLALAGNAYRGPGLSDAAVAGVAAAQALTAER